MCSVLSYKGKVHFDICVLEELRQKSLVTCLGLGLENHFESMSDGSLRDSVEWRLRKISKTKFLKLWQSKTQGQYSRGWIRATNGALTVQDGDTPLWPCLQRDRKLTRYGKGKEMNRTWYLICWENERDVDWRKRGAKRHLYLYIISIQIKIAGLSPCDPGKPEAPKLWT